MTLLAAEVAAQVLKKSDQALGVVTVGLDLEEEPTAGAVPAVRQHRRGRHLLPVEGVDQDRGFAAGCPGAADGRLLGDAAFILEGNLGLAGGGRFFYRWPALRYPRGIASSLRSRARLAGRCSVQPIAPQHLPHMAGVIVHPCHSLDHLATRGRVHRSVPKPCARAPWRSAASTCRRCAACSRGRAPGPTRAAQGGGPATPPLPDTSGSRSGGSPCSPARHRRRIARPPRKVAPLASVASPAPGSLAAPPLPPPPCMPTHAV